MSTIRYRALQQTESNRQEPVLARWRFPDCYVQMVDFATDDFK